MTTCFTLDSESVTRRIRQLVASTASAFTYEGKRYVLMDDVRQLLGTGDAATTVGCLVISPGQEANTKETALLLKAVGVQSLIILFDGVEMQPGDNSNAKVCELVRSLAFKEVRYYTLAVDDTPVTLLRTLRTARPLVDVPKQLTTVREGDVQLLVELYRSVRALLTVGCKCSLYVDSQGELTVTVERLNHYNRKTVQVGPSMTFIQSGSTAVATVNADNLHLIQGARVVLRTDGRTIGFGTVL